MNSPTLNQWGRIGKVTSRGDLILTIGHSGKRRLSGNLTRRTIKIKTAAFSVSR
ncbi:MAG: hypothetical protein V1706_14635 [Pseudomonadota bacterium]